MSNHSEHSIADQVLDQLADDELSEDQRRQVLSALDLDPQGWRRCAMAFLEAQAWRRAMTGLASSAGSGSTESLPAHRPDGAGAKGCANRRMIDNSWLATAASIFVAFLVGVLSQRVLSHPHGASAPEEAVTHTLAEHSLDRGRVEASGNGVAAGPTSEVNRGPEPPEAAPSDLDVEYVSAPATKMLEALRQSGHQIERRRGIIPFRFDDGRRGYVPVEDLFVVPTRLATY